MVHQGYWAQMPAHGQTASRDHKESQKSSTFRQGQPGGPVTCACMQSPSLKDRALSLTHF